MAQPQAAGAQGVQRSFDGGIWPVSVSAHGLCFVSALLPIDKATGTLISGYSDLNDAPELRVGNLFVDSLEEGMGAQVWHLFEQLEAILGDKGLSKERILLMNGWYQDFRDWPVMNRLRHQFYAPDFPVSTGFGVAGLPVPGARAMYDAIVAEASRDAVHIGSHQQVGSYFPGSRSKELLFLAGEVAGDPSSGVVIRSPADLGADADVVRSRSLGSEGWEGRIRAQAWFIYNRIRETLRSAGSDLDCVVKQTVYLQDLRDYAVVEPVGRALLGDHLPATLLVCVDQFGHPDFRMEVEVVAVAGSAPDRVADQDLMGIGGGYPVAAAAGGFLFVPVAPVRADGRVRSDGLDLSARAVAQANQLFDNLEGVLAARRMNLSDVVRQTLYVTDPMVLPAVEQTAAARLASGRPATTVVRVRSIAPPGAVVQGDFIAAGRSS